ncbi:MAG TPA: UPF0182 family protein [Streptosporangiaceae bacterium]|nr:UPF0182 family protein [Streptosporangiaceae bacterium]
MSFRPSPADRPPGRPALRLPRWPRYLVPVVAGLIALGVLVTIIAGVWTDWLWYRSVNYGSVFGVTYGTRWALFFVVGIFMTATIGLNAVLAFRLRPVYRPAAAAERPGVDALRMAVDPHRRLLLGIVLGLIGVISGVTASGAWRTWLLFINQVPFGRTDPQFNLDISFFVFTYPFLRLVLSYLFAAVFLSLLAAVAVHVLYGGLGWQARRPRATMAAQAHLFVLVGVFVLLKGAAYWVDRWGIDFSQRGAVTTGASYTDVNAVLPAKTVLAVIAVLCALLFFAGALRRSALLPAVGLGLLVLSAILIGGVYPAIIQQFVVKPNELAKEYPYIQREITQTRLAYGVSQVQPQSYTGTSLESAGTLFNASLNLPGFRLMDPTVVSRAFEQLQQVKGFYQFPGILSVDRYVLPGEGRVPQDLVVAVRGLTGPPPGQGNWINTHLVYTHGFGFVAARENSVAGGGTPDWVESDLPPRGELTIRQPRVYFGEAEGNYVIVGGPKGRPGGEELDYPFPNASGQKNTTYQGSGGVPVGSPLNRILYATKFRELNILLSGAINGNSKILYDREPLARIAKVAPFLTLDGTPYPVVAHGSIWWVVDGYTTTDLYPYSQRLSMPAATSTSQTPGGSIAGQPTGAINYIHNSVKAVVNAYTGAVYLYQWGPPDPMLQAWRNAFPGVIKSSQDIPSYLLPHMRYPPDLFEVQRQVLAQYHVLNPQAFYGGQNFWEVPNDPTGAVANKFSQPPYYLTEKIPGYGQPEFSQTTTFVPRNRANLAAVMVVDSNPTQPGYGTIHILQLPQNAVTEGPSQVQGAFESYARASIELTQLRKGGSTVTLGNMITIPVGGGLLYIEPVYVTANAAGATGSYPSLQRVFAFYGGHPVGYGATLQAALQQVFSGTTPGQSAPGGASGGSVNARVIADLKQAQQFYAKAQAALRNGDLATYGQDIANMAAQIANAQADAKAGHPATTSPNPGPTPTPSPSASR